MSDCFEQGININTQKKSMSVSGVRITGPLEEDCNKTNVDVSRRHYLRSTTICYIIRDSNARILMTNIKKLGHCPTLMAECEAIQHAI